MINLDKHKVNISCPKCNFDNIASIRQFRVEDVIICRGCKSNISLIDHKRSVEKSKREIRRALHSLMSQIERIGKINIKIKL